MKVKCIKGTREKQFLIKGNEYIVENKGVSHLYVICENGEIRGFKKNRFIEIYYTREDFPQSAKYKVKPNRIQFLTDFEDEEIVEFSCFHCRPGAISEGLAWYTNGNKRNLINVEDLICLR